MADDKSEPKKLIFKGDKRLLENSVVGSLMVPIAIVLVGALIIFGVTKMLSTETSYKDHVRELQSKAFGNKWIAAFELSKKISSSQIPHEDIPWLIQSLDEVFKGSPDPRTRDFVVVALGALRNELSFQTLKLALLDENSNVSFHAVVALGNMPIGANIDWLALSPLFNSEDHALRQATVLAVGTHKVKSLEEKVVAKLQDESVAVRYSAATSLVYFKNSNSLETIKEVFFRSDKKGFDANQVANLKLNILNAIEKVKWIELEEVVQEVIKRDNNLKVTTKARQVLNELKN
jgi:HEAT repeat protein